MAAAAPLPPRTDSANADARIILAEQNISTIGTALERFIAAQQVENNRLYDAVNKMGEHFTNGLDSVKEAVNSRGRITGQMVFSIIATILSLATLVGGFTHFYVQNQLAIAGGTTTQLAIQVAAAKADGERNRDKLWEAVQRLDNKADAQTQDELRRLRDFRDKVTGTTGNATPTTLHTTNAQTPTP